MQLYGLRYPFAMRLSMLSPACVALVFSLTAAAQEPPAVATVRSAAGFHTAAEGKFQAYETSLSTHCAVVAADWTRATHIMYGTPQAAPDGNLVNATWVEKVPGTACGQSRRYSVLVTIRAGKASVISLLPGDSYAGPQLQHDAILPLYGAVAGIVLRGQNCQVDVLDTHFAGSAPPVPRQPWNEIWTVGACGKQLNVPIQFVPDAVGGGTSIHIDAKSVAPAP